MTLDSRSILRELRLALGLLISLSTNLHRVSAEPATDESAKPVPASSMSFSELQQVVGALPEGDESPARQIDEWLAGRDLSELSIEDVRWCLVSSLPNERDRHAFTVTWTGLLKVPRTGAYTFSVSPINVNGVGRDAVRQTISVTVAGVESLNTSQGTPADAPPSSSEGQEKAVPRRIVKSPATPWHWKGAPIQLQADRDVPVQVVLEYEGSAADESSPPSAILSWEGPGLKRQPVGESFFSGGAEAQGKLSAEYKWQDSRGPQTLVQTSPNIDYAWTAAARVAPSRPQLVARLADRLWLLAIDPEYVKKCAAGESEHFYFQDYESTEYLSAARRQQFLELLVERPQLLAKVGDQAVLQLYRKLRFGAEEAALDMLGHWMQLHADAAPELAIDFFERNRRVYRELADHLALQQPEQLDALRDQYLITDDERCALPTAYALSYGYSVLDRLTLPVARERRDVRSESRFGEWVELLAEKLADDSISGDLRINWLLARAQSMEINSEPIQRGLVVRENLFAGKGWLDEASLIAEEEPTRMRLLQEGVARFATYRMWREAEQALKSGLSATEVADWQGKLNSLKSEAESLVAAEQRRTQEAILEELKSRRQQAVGRGDDSSVDRYSSKIEQLQAANAVGE